MDAHSMREHLPSGVSVSTPRPGDSWPSRANTCGSPGGPLYYGQDVSGVMRPTRTWARRRPAAHLPDRRPAVVDYPGRALLPHDAVDCVRATAGPPARCGPSRVQRRRRDGDSHRGAGRAHRVVHTAGDVLRVLTGRGYREHSVICPASELASSAPGLLESPLVAANGSSAGAQPRRELSPASVYRDEGQRGGRTAGRKAYILA